MIKQTERKRKRQRKRERIGVERERVIKREVASDVYWLGERDRKKQKEG
jgi:hypothetical protein